MCSIKATLEHPDGKQETFFRPAEVGAGDGSKGDLGKLSVWIGEVQKDLNAALTTVVERDRHASCSSGAVQNQKGSGLQEDEEDEDDDEEDNKTNGNVQPPTKKKKT